MTNKIAGQINEIARNVEDLADYEVRLQVMQGSEKIITSSDPVKVAAWVKGAMERLDSLVDEPTRRQIMLNCGHNCILVNSRPLEDARSRRRRFTDEEAFLAAEVKKPPRGMRFERDGDLLIHCYTPHTYGPRMRCYCSLLRGLPPDQTVSSTYCQCSRGFVEKYWEGILGRAVHVDLVESAATGAGECKFVVHL